jgi:glycosyltransferase involved in cell wall biosynthesis
MGRIIIVGPLPPPITGMALGTERMISDLKERGCDVVCYNISPGSLRKTPTYHARKAWRVVRSALAIMTTRNLRVFYMPCDAGWGGIYTLLLTLCARSRKLQVFLHHRSYMYIDTPTRLMAAIIATSGKNARHITLCEDMSTALRSNYGKSIATYTLNNMYRTTLYDVPEHPTQPFTLGLLSNLGPEKGLLDFISLIKNLIAKKRQVHGILAGPAWQDEDETTINQALIDLEGALEWRGKVVGEEKDRFYSNINVFIFPTRYRVESQGVVQLDALARGIPVIAFARGCIRSDVGPAGLVVQQHECFEEKAAQQIIEWIDNPALYREVCAIAKERGRSLHAESFLQQQTFLDLLQRAAV